MSVLPLGNPADVSNPFALSPSTSSGQALSKGSQGSFPVINLIGCGRVGRTLAQLWAQHGVLALQDIHTRSLASAQAAVVALGQGRAVAALAALRAAPLTLLAVPDAQLPAAAAALAAACAQAGHAPGLAFHCSGALAADVLAPLAAQGWRVASAHCILSFSDPRRAVAQFPGTACALEGDADACATLQPLFAAIGAQCFPLHSADKLRYHAAAVFATNFLPVLQDRAEALWRSAGVPQALLPGLRQALLHHSVANICAQGPAAALTGPAARGDVPAITGQAQALQAWDAPTAEAYRALSNLALRLAGQDGMA